MGKTVLVLRAAISRGTTALPRRCEPAHEVLRPRSATPVAVSCETSRSTFDLDDIERAIDAFPEHLLIPKPAPAEKTFAHLPPPPVHATVEAAPDTDLLDDRAFDDAWDTFISTPMPTDEGALAVLGG